ncbi:MAG TPA: hypothetical protein VGF14_07745 [Alphaproteobacteria bacterium]
MVQNTNQNPDEETGGVNGSQPDDEFERIAAEEIGTETTLPEEEKPISLLALWDAINDLYKPRTYPASDISPEQCMQLVMLLPQHRALANMLLVRHQFDQTPFYQGSDAQQLERTLRNKKAFGFDIDNILALHLSTLQKNLAAPVRGQAKTGRLFKTEILVADLKYRTRDDRIPVEDVMKNPESFLKDLDDKNSFGFRTQPQNRLIYKFDDRVRTEFDGKTYRVHYKTDFWGDNKLDKIDGKWKRHNPLNEGLQDHSRMILMQLKENGHKTFSFEGKCSMRFVEAMLEARKRVPGIHLNVGSLTDLGFSEKQVKKLEKKYGLIIPRPVPEQEQGPIQLGRDSFFERLKRGAGNFGAWTVDALRGTPRAIRTFFTTPLRQTLRNTGQSLKDTGQRLANKARTIRRKMGHAMGHVGDKIADGLNGFFDAVERTYKSNSIGGKLLRGYTYGSVHIVLGAGLGVLAPIVGLVNKKAGRKLRRIKVKAYLKMRQEKREYRQRWAQERQQQQAAATAQPRVSAWQKIKNAWSKAGRGVKKVGRGINNGIKTASERKNRGYTFIAGMAAVTGVMIANPEPPIDTGCEPYRDPLTKIIDGTKSTWEFLKKEIETDPTRNFKSHEYYREAKNVGKRPDDPTYLRYRDAEKPDVPPPNLVLPDASTYTAPHNENRVDFRVEARRYREAMASMTAPAAVKSPAKTIYQANKTDLAGLGLKPLSPRTEFKI